MRRRRQLIVVSLAGAAYLWLNNLDLVSYLHGQTNKWNSFRYFLYSTCNNVTKNNIKKASLSNILSFLFCSIINPPKVSQHNINPNSYKVKKYRSNYHITIIISFGCLSWFFFDTNALRNFVSYYVNMLIIILFCIISIVSYEDGIFIRK